MLNVKYWRIFLWRHFSACSSFYCFGRYGIQRGVYKKILNNFYCSVFMIWLYLQKTMYRPCDLDLWPIKVYKIHHISVLYEFQIDISTNSWEIKYQNTGIGLLHVKRRTRQTWRYSTNHVYLHRPNAFGFWQTRLHLCYETLKRISNFSELA